MTVWDDAFRTILNDDDLAESATYYAGGAGPGQALRVIRSAPIQPVYGPAGGIGNLQASLLADMLITDVPTQPAEGDKLIFGTEEFSIKSAERDDLKLVWRLTLAAEA